MDFEQYELESLSAQDCEEIHLDLGPFCRKPRRTLVRGIARAIASL